MKKRILIMAAGTGGHVFPALAVAKVLQQQAVEIAWLGTKKGLENKLLAECNIPLYKISITGLRGYGFCRLFFSSIKLVRAFFQALFIIKRFNPDVVLGMGGFVCGPGGLAAWVLRKRLVLHEQNGVPGVTNKILVYFASDILTGFPDVLAGKKTQYVGNPLRDEIVQVSAPEERFAGRTGSIRILVFGGSQGARSFNEVVPKALALLPKELAIEVWHQSGEQNLEFALNNYNKAEISAKIVPFINEMAKAYEWADLVICRSGASTVSEISAIGLAAIFIPYPFHKDEQQAYNARLLVDANAAVLMRQVEFTPENLAILLEQLIVGAGHPLLNMAKQGRVLRKVDATEKIVGILLNA